MEFDHVGQHCAEPLCRQKDFLPFTCDACHRTYCLQHRSYLTHQCEASKGKDFTSLDCPVCGKSVKFTKAQDANIIWEDHYLHGCSQQSTPSSSSQRPRCARVGCTTGLGPSNTIQCPKCNKKVCIAHRMSEDHPCIATTTNHRAAFLQRFDNTKNNNSTSAKSATTTMNPSTSKTTSKMKSVPKSSTSVGRRAEDPSNTMRGTAERRMKDNNSQQHQQQSQQTSPIPIVIDDSDYTCPFCEAKMSTADHLHRHIATTHDEVSNDTATSSHQRQTSATTGEICPVCSCRFDDPILLVAHFEQAHQEPVGQNTNTNSDSGCMVT